LGSETGFNETARIVTIPRGKNELFVRIENIADAHDNAPNSQQKVVNLQAYLYNLWA